MVHHFQLYGTVKPYFGRTTRPATFSMETVVENRIAPTTWLAPRDAYRHTPLPLEIVHQVARRQNWKIVEKHQACDVVVPLGSERKQTVSVELAQHNQPAYPLLVYSSRCGPATSRNAMVLLRRNRHLFQTAFATEKAGDLEWIVLRGFQRADGADTTDVEQMIKSIATDADRIESKLVSTDQF